MTKQRLVVWGQGTCEGYIVGHLGGPLQGSWIKVDPARLTMGLLEDRHGTWGQFLDSIAGCLVDGDLKGGDVNRDALRALTLPEFAQISNAVADAYRLPPDSQADTPKVAAKADLIGDATVIAHIPASTINVLLDELETLDPPTRRHAVYAYVEPDGTLFELGWVGSYRGTYEQACLYPRAPRGVRAKEVASVDDLIGRLRDSFGKTIYGYKGGEYSVDPTRPFWFAETEDQHPGWYFSNIRVDVAPDSGKKRVLVVCKEPT